MKLVVDRQTDKQTDRQMDQLTWWHIELLLQLKTWQCTPAWLISLTFYFEIIINMPISCIRKIFIGNQKQNGCILVFWLIHSSCSYLSPVAIYHLLDVLCGVVCLHLNLLHFVLHFVIWLTLFRAFVVSMLIIDNYVIPKHIDFSAMGVMVILRLTRGSLVASFGCSGHFGIFPL